MPSICGSRTCRTKKTAEKRVPLECISDTATDTAPYVPADCEGLITFKDDRLAAAVRSAADLPSGSGMTYDDVVGITSLNGNNAGIASLSGIECLTGLSALFSSNNDIRPQLPSGPHQPTVAHRRRSHQFARQSERQHPAEAIREGMPRHLWIRNASMAPFSCMPLNPSDFDFTQSSQPPMNSFKEGNLATAPTCPKAPPAPSRTSPWRRASSIGSA